MSEILITHTRPEHLPHCAELQRVCFPTLAPEEHLTEAHIARHLGLFPEGQFVAIETGTSRVIGMTAGFRTHFDFNHTHGHTFLRAVSGGWFSRHNPHGSHYYGADMSVHPDFRGRGLARGFHEARKELCRNLGLKGQAVCGMIPGYAAYTRVMTAFEYVNHVVKGAIYDSTLTTQIRNGFQVRGLVANYVMDAPTRGWATVLEWRNSDYVEIALPQIPFENASSETRQGRIW